LQAFQLDIWIPDKTAFDVLNMRMKAESSM